MNSTEQREAFTVMVAIMKKDSGSESCYDSKELQKVFLGVRG